MANTIDTPTLVGPESIPLVRTAPWAVNCLTTDTTPAVEIKAAVTGSSLYLTHVTMSGATVDVAVTLFDGTDEILGPITLQADGGGNFSKDWKDPLKLSKSTALKVTGTNNVAFTVYVEGFTGTP